MTDDAQVDGPVTEPQSDYLYVLGHARTGTTAWARFFNSSPNVLMLHEAWADTEGRFLYWRERYNRMHHVNGQPPVKGYLLPEAWGGTYVDVERAARLRFQYYGDKLALRTVDDAQFSALAPSIRQRWVGTQDSSRVLLTLRNVDSTIWSNLAMFGDRLNVSVEEQARTYYASLSIVMWLQLVVFFSGRTSAFAILEHVAGSTSEDLADALELEQFTPTVPSAVFSSTVSRTGGGGTSDLRPILKKSSAETQAARDLCIEVYRAIEETSSINLDGSRNLTPRALCTQRSSAVYGSFLALHQFLMETGLLHSSQLMDPALAGDERRLSMVLELDAPATVVPPKLDASPSGVAESDEVDLVRPSDLS